MKLFCTCCETEKEDTEFLWRGKRGNFKVTYCNECSQQNMREYVKQRNVGRKAE